MENQYNSDEQLVEATLTRRIVPAAERKNFTRLNLDALVARTSFLPPAFELVPRLLLLLDDPEVNCEDLAEIIRVDAGLTADVLQIANSASHGGARRTDCLSEAIMRVGLREIYTAVMKIVTSPALRSDEAFPGQRVDMWRHSLAAAVAAQTVARHVSGEDPEIVFTAGLLHDIGKALLIQALGRDYIELSEICAARNFPIIHAEREAFQVDHVEAAGRLLRAWKFPERIVQAIAGHHEPLKASPETRLLAALLYAGNALAYRIGEGNGYPPYSIHPDIGALKILNLTAADLKGYEEEVQENLRREQERLW